MKKKEEKKNNKIVYIIIGILAAIALVVGFYIGYNSVANDKETDAEKFASEYSIDNDNVFVYRTLEEINKILKNGTGIVYLGFPECPWCKGYVPYLNEVAKKAKLDKIYYFNILKDRKNNTDNYKKTVELLKDYLKYDDEGNKRIYVPAVIAVNKGKIVGFDDETSYDTKGYEKPEDYWKNEDLDGLKNRLSKMINDVSFDYCTTDCNK